MVALTHWGRVTHICVSKLTIIDSDNGLSPDRRQAIIWINAGILFIGPLGTNFSEILIEILTFSLKKMRLKVSSVKRPPSCLGLNVLMGQSGVSEANPETLAKTGRCLIKPKDNTTQCVCKFWWQINILISLETFCYGLWRESGLVRYNLNNISL